MLFLSSSIPSLIFRFFIFRFLLLILFRTFLEEGILFGIRDFDFGEEFGEDYTYGFFLWGLGPGFYIAIAAGILGIIGAAIISDEGFS
ncbi:MAG: hypothetical protein EU529_15055 [Promethearchaeota archaeon]|nr:MAG: hypothetical protein EU529_15055 [Candidatus Lokiarchaeota archaeon]